MMQRPKLRQEHVDERLDFAHTYQTFGEEWKRVLFSHETAFDFDGADHGNYYWHDYRKQRRMEDDQQAGWRKCQNWTGCSFDYMTTMGTVTGSLTAKQHRYILKGCLMAVWEKIEAGYEEGILLQQHNDSHHTAQLTKEWQESQGVESLLWATNLPDMNIVENIFGILSRVVYAGNSQHNTMDELHVLHSIEQAWTNLHQDTIRNLVDSMISQIFELISNHGRTTSY